MHLLGAACLLQASRVYEKEPINIRMCVYLMRNCYTQHNIIEMEEYIASVLSLRGEAYSGTEGLVCLTQSISMMCEAMPPEVATQKDDLKHLAYYYAERNLVDSYAALQRSPPLFAAGVVFAARVTLLAAQPPPPTTLHRKSLNRPSACNEKENYQNSPSGDPIAERYAADDEVCFAESPPSPPPCHRRLRCPSSLWPEQMASHTELSSLIVYKMALSISRVMMKDVLIPRVSSAHGGRYPQLFVAARNKYKQGLHGRVAELPYSGSMESTIDSHCTCDLCRNEGGDTVEQW